MDSSWPSTLTWSSGGEAIASIQVCGQAGQLELKYRCRSAGEDWESIRYTVSIEWTPCNYGGSRPWFICPGRGCGRRVAVLYGGTVFACRRCHNLVYESQHEPLHDRAWRRAQKIREKLGGSGSMADDFPDKPKGMHWQTYRRFCEQYESAENRSWPPWLLQALLAH